MTSRFHDRPGHDTSSCASPRKQEQRRPKKTERETLPQKTDQHVQRDLEKAVITWDIFWRELTSYHLYHLYTISSILYWKDSLCHKCIGQDLTRIYCPSIYVNLRQSTSPMLSIAQHCSAASAFLGILGVRRILSDDQLEHRPDIWDRYRWHFMVLHGTSMHSDTFPADRLTELAESCCTSIWCMAGKVLLTMPVVHNEHTVDTCLLVLPVSESFSTSLNWSMWLPEKEKGLASSFKARSSLMSPLLSNSGDFVRAS